MEIKQLQKDIDDWIKTFGIRYFDELTNTILLNEEVGELSSLIARVYGEQSFKASKKPKDVKQSIADEMADVLFVLTCLANQMDIDLESAIVANLNKKTIRDKDRHITNPKL